MISHATKTLQAGAVLKEQTSLVFNKKKAEAASGSSSIKMSLKDEKKEG